MIAIVFPPVVSTGLGCYYPASAVLAGFLHARGVTSTQHDLNTDLLRYICRDSAALKEVCERGHPRWVYDVERLIISRNTILNQLERGEFDWADSALADAARAIFCCLETQFSTLTSTRKFLEQAARGIADGTPSLVAVTIAMGPQLLPAQKLMMALRRTLPAARIVIGGPVVTLLSNNEIADLLGPKGADLAVRFEGEAPLYAVAQQIAEGRWEPEEVPNGVYLDDGVVRCSEVIRAIRVDELPLPKYDSDIITTNNVRTLSVIQARGCYWGQCAYCDYVNLYGGGVRYQSVAAERLASDIEALAHSHDIQRFTLVTEALPPGLAKRFAQELASRDIKCRWTSFAMVHEKFDAELFDNLARSGCEYLVIGLESLSDAALKNVKKYASRDDNIRFVELALNSGVGICLNLIPDLPGTTYREALDSYLIYCDWKDRGAKFSVFPFEATLSSEIGQNPTKFGLVQAAASEIYVGQSSFQQNHVAVIDPAMSVEERELILDIYRTLEVSGNARAINGVQSEAAPRGLHGRGADCGSIL
jgi:hypothetical protein